MIQNLSHIASQLVQKHKLTQAILQTIKGKGPQGLIMKSDILDYTFKRTQQVKESPPVVSQQVKQQTVQPNQEIGTSPNDYLHFKQSIPHYHLNINVNLEKIFALQKKVQIQLEDDILIESYLLKAIIKSINKNKIMNSKFNNNSIHEYKNINLQVEIIDEKGVTTHYLNKAESMNIHKINESIQNENERQICTGCVKFYKGADQVNEIINIEHGCVITVDSIKEVMGVDSTTGRLQMNRALNITLGSDHRVIDGAVAAQFLHNLQSFLQSPNSLML